MFLPTLKSVQHLGGSGSISEIVTAAIDLEHFSEAQQDVVHNDGPETKIGYRIAWARTYLKAFGLLTNSSRGVWSITEAGDRFLAADLSDSQKAAKLMQMRAEKIRADAAKRAARDLPSLPPIAVAEDVDVEADEAEESANLSAVSSWKERVILTLTSEQFSPSQFERLTQRLFREASFESVTVTGRSGDQGIDGVGIYRLGLLSFPVYFQCKRYKGSVGKGPRFPGSPPGTRRERHPAHDRRVHSCCEGRGVSGRCNTGGPH